MINHEVIDLSMLQLAMIWMYLTEFIEIIKLFISFEV